MYELKDKNKLILFTSKVDYLNYKDYLENGLRLISKKGRTYKFNNMAILIDVTFQGREKYVLHIGKREYTNNKYIKKYLELI